MMKIRSRIAAALVTIGLLYLNAGSGAMGVEIGGLLVGNAKSFRPAADSGLRDAELTTRLGDSEVDAIDDDAAIIAPIVFLGVPVCPPAVAGIIVPVAIDPIDRHAIRHFSHIGKEILERLPSFADRNATPAVQGIALRLWVAATPLHGDPASIGAISGPISACPTVSSLWQIFERAFQAQAPTRPGRSVSQLRFVNSHLITAGTAA